MPKLLRVLVVDDNRDIVLTMSELLRMEGHDTKECFSGSEVLDCVKEYAPDVVLLDIGLPGKSGWEVARQIRELSPDPHPVLIAITGQYTKASDEVLGKLNGFDCYLVKPIDPKLLMVLIGKALHPVSRA